MNTNILFLIIVLIASSCATPKVEPKKTKDGIEIAETTTRDAAANEKPEKAPHVENRARSEKQKKFLSGQKAFDQKEYEKALTFLLPVIHDADVDEMNYFGAALVFDALINLKKYPDLCSEVEKIKKPLCGLGSKVKPEQLEFCKDLYEIDATCKQPESKSQPEIKPESESKTKSESEASPKTP